MYSSQHAKGDQMQVQLGNLNLCLDQGPIPTHTKQIHCLQEQLLSPDHPGL